MMLAVDGHRGFEGPDDPSLGWGDPSLTWNVGGWGQNWYRVLVEG